MLKQSGGGGTGKKECGSEEGREGCALKSAYRGMHKKRMEKEIWPDAGKGWEGGTRCRKRSGD